MERGKRSSLLTFVLALIAIGAQLLLLSVRGTWSIVWGDEGTYLAMTASLAEDGDLEFATADRERLESSPPGGRRAVILQKTEAGISYSKPAVYAAAGAPFYRLFGETGVVVLNALSFLAAVSLALACVRRRGGGKDSGPAVVTFLGTGVLLSYVVWTMSDSLQASLILGGAALLLGRLGAPAGTGRTDRFLDGHWSLVLGSLLLGLAVSMRYPNLIVALAPSAALFTERRRGKALLSAALVILTVVAALGLNQALTGAPVPYKADRATFNSESGYPAGDGGEDRLSQFETARATHRLGIVPTIQARASLYSAFYFFLGRHTGLLLYGPAALVFGWLALRRGGRVGLTLVLAVAALALFYLLWMPRNYFGGATFLGNRYFLTGYALLMLAPSRPPGRRALTAIWLLTALVFSSALVSSIRSRDLDRSSQMHAYAGLFRLFPYESTAMDLDGRRDRYWSDELVRFVDPWAKVDEHGFRLTAGGPAAELVTASGREHGAVRLLVQANVPEVEIIYRDWLQKKRFRLQAPRGGARGFLEIVPSPTIRRHSYWWDPIVPLKVRALRLAAETPDGEAARVDIRYTGPYRFASRFYRGEVEQLRIPGRGKAADLQPVPVRIRNSGKRYWATDDPIPIFLAYRIYSTTREQGADPVAVGPLTALPKRVPPGSVLETELDLVWPSAPGRYLIDVDLAVAGISWFEEWNGAPLASRQVVVLGAEE